ncbi:MAG: 4Fe-4S dicluster domain-containing protein [Promethearchaeota archaeon]
MSTSEEVKKNDTDNKMDEAKKIMHKILVVDPRRCIGCEICESVCSEVHEGEFNPLDSRINRVRIEPIINSALSCLSCYDPDCVNACPLKAISKDEETGIIHVDYDKCDGCGACVRACLFGAIQISTKLRKAITCDLCESTEYGEPQCVEYCPKGAIFIREIDPTIDENRLVTYKRLLDEGFPDSEDGFYN